MHISQIGQKSRDLLDQLEREHPMHVPVPTRARTLLKGLDAVFISTRVDEQLGYITPADIREIALLMRLYSERLLDLDDRAKVIARQPV